MAKLLKISNIFCYIAGGFALASLCGFLFSYFYIFTPDFSIINVPGYTILFGGTASIVSGGVRYDISFSLNTLAIVLIQLIVVGGIASFISHSNTKTVALTSFLILLGCIGFWLGPVLLFLANPNFILSSANLDYGYYLICVISSLATLLSFGSLGMKIYISKHSK